MHFIQSPAVAKNDIALNNVFVHVYREIYECLLIEVSNGKKIRTYVLFQGISFYVRISFSLEKGIPFSNICIRQPACLL